MDRQLVSDTNYIPIFTQLDNKDRDISQKDKQTCELCSQIKAAMYSSVNVNEKVWKTALDLYIRHDPETHITAPPRTTHTGNGTHQGWWAGTLTQSVDDETTEDDMMKAISKIFTQKTCPVDRYAWYVEYTKKATPHIHFIYITNTGGRIHAKVFKRYWKQWDEKRRLGKGHQGGYHAPVYSDIAYREYISKDGGKSDKNFSIEDV